MKQIIDTRYYFDNVPEWASSSRLLYTPVLDNHCGLIYMPQYSKTQYINMDIGFIDGNDILGSRLLVYNPGDLPINFKLNFNLEPRSQMTRMDKFQIRRYNVDQLSLVDAIDLCGLTTFNEEDDIPFKYANKYFKEISYTETIKDDVEYKQPNYLDLPMHPNFCYYIQPIPRKLLGKFIRHFYWQSSKLFENDFSFEEGSKIAERYEWKLERCITEEEEQHLYWKTLNNLLKEYSYYLTEEELKNMIDVYLNSPKEYYYSGEDLIDNKINFNINSFPEYYTEDLLEFSCTDMPTDNLVLDSEKRILYSKNQSDDFYSYKDSKTILNENIVRGTWFKIPKGWSLIEVAPVQDRGQNRDKTWKAARAYDWGYTAEMRETYGELYNKIYEEIEQKFLLKYEKSSINFRTWYTQEIEGNVDNPIKKAYYERLTEEREIEFLKEIQLYWSGNKGRYSIKGLVSEWWWYANNYIWGNFPPTYWTYADLLNKATIKYIPLFY